MQIFVVTHGKEKAADLEGLSIYMIEGKVRGILKVDSENGKYDVGKLMVELKSHSEDLAKGPITLVGDNTLWNLQNMVKNLNLDILHVVKDSQNKIKEAKLYIVQQ